MKAPRWLVVCAISAAVTTAAAASGTTEGRLVVRERGKAIDLPLEHTDVHIRVDGYLADATVTQRFKNTSKTKIEAVYLFPLPTDAAVSEMMIAIGTRTIRGTIQKRADATRIYEQARDRGQVAALLTQERANLFTQSIANLEPGATIEVTLRYVQRLAYDDGGYELVFPIVAPPRYMPSGATDPALQPPVLPAGVRGGHDIALAVELDAGVPIEELRSPSHQLAIARPSASRAAVHLQPFDTIPNKDFILRYRVAGRAPAVGVLGYRDGGDGSFILIAQPPASSAPIAITPREIVFVLDTSSSMRGAPLAKAKDVIRHVLRALRPDDTFQIVRFDDNASALGTAPIANKPRNIQLTLDWLAALDAGGGTEMTTGLDAALAVPHDAARLRIIALLTDGYIGNEDEILAKLGRKLGDARVFSFGVGTAVNRYLLEEVAAVGRGTVHVVRPDEDTVAAARAFERRIDAPVLTDLRVDWGGLAVADVVPRALPDVFVGQPVVIAGHYKRGGAGIVTVHGKQGGRDVRFDVRVELPDRDVSRPAIAAVWARQRIAELSRKLVRANDPAVEREIVELALAHHLLTRYTAFVAVDDSRVTAGGASKRVVVPVEVPDAMSAVSRSGFGAGGGGTGWGTIGLGNYGTVGHGGGVGYGVGYASGGMVGRAAATPTVVIAQPSVVSGDLDKAIIRRYIKRQINKVQYCYEKALLGHPDLAGTIVVKFTISATGHVVESTAAGLAADVDKCVAGVIATIEFPAAHGGGNVQVNYPFTFKPNIIHEKVVP
jgi:Ca-activated chloride channel family protein